MEVIRKSFFKSILFSLVICGLLTVISAIISFLTYMLYARVDIGSDFRPYAFIAPIVPKKTRLRPYCPIDPILSKNIDLNTDVEIQKPTKWRNNPGDPIISPFIPSPCGDSNKLAYFVIDYSGERCCPIGTFKPINYTEELILEKDLTAICKIKMDCCSKSYILKLNEKSESTPASIYDKSSYFVKYFQLRPNPFVVSSPYASIAGMDIRRIEEMLKVDSLEAYNYKLPFNDCEFRKYAESLFVGIALLHKEGIAHNDIKPHNIGIDAQNRLKIYDFEISHDEKMPFEKIKRGSLDFMAPENFFSAKFEAGVLLGCRSDWWSFGVTLYYLLEGNIPYYAYESMRALCGKITPLKVKEIYAEEKFYGITKVGVPKALKDFVHSLLEIDFERRLGARGFKEIMEHPYLKNSSYIRGFGL